MTADRRIVALSLAGYPVIKSTQRQSAQRPIIDGSVRDSLVLQL
jgi:hypothetical protein